MKYTKLYHEIVTFKQDVGHKVGRDSGFRKKGEGEGGGNREQVRTFHKLWEGFNEVYSRHSTWVSKEGGAWACLSPFTSAM